MTDGVITQNMNYGSAGNVIATTFEYDTMGRTTKTVVAGTAQAGYTYSGNQLSQILRTDSDGSTQSYNFTYDGFENLTGIAVGSRTLASYQYGDANGLLEKMTYGNGDYVTYTYNNDGLRTSKESDSGDCVAYLISDGRIIGEEHYHVDDGFQFARRYIFDESGSVCGYSVGYTLDGSAWTDYYFIKNLQGDVLQIFRASDNAIVGEYTYDSWGNVLTATGAQALANPFRYRGYYYDVETNLYYCGQRYYDPEIGRWISADSYASTGQGVIGYNMFAYCLNNPINMIDLTGDLPQWVKDAGDWLNDNVFQPVKVFVEEVKEDISNFDIYNESEEVALESNYFSMYKGAPVIRTGGDRSGSFGIIFLTYETNDRSNPEDVVRHEYGHTQQLLDLGPVRYGLCIGLPSLFEWGSDPNYYERPWEVTADLYGNVGSRLHPNEKISAGYDYLTISKVFGIFSWFLIE